MKPKISLASFLVLIGTFIYFILGTAGYDPDFGWHLRFGQIILSQGSIPRLDQFSYTMPSYHFVDHEWTVSVVMAWIFDHFGYIPLVVLFALICIRTLYLLAEGFEKRWTWLLLFLVASTFFAFIGVRVQIITWMFLALLMRLLWQPKEWKRWRYYIPLVFLLWANMHGGFAGGFIIMTIFLIGNGIEKKSFDKKDFFVILLSFFATFINPFGYHLWEEVFRSLTDSSLHAIIQEWAPAVYFPTMAFWIYVALSLSLVIIYRKRYTKTTLFLYGLLFLGGITSMRNIPLFLIVSFYPTLQAVGFLEKEAKSYKHGIERFLKAYVGFTMLCLFLVLPQIGMFFYGVATADKGKPGYPAGAIAYLRKNTPDNQIFSSYNWGGYLIWKLPEKKVFIDGRMPSWRNPNAPSTESSYALGEYLSVLRGEVPFAVTQKKYHIDTVLAPVSELKEHHVMFLGFDLTKNPFLKKFLRADTSFAPIVKTVTQEGWKEVYRDNAAVIYQAPNSIMENHGS